MTIHITVSIRDTQLAAYGRPYYAPTTGAAIRSFQDEAMNPESIINKHPEDFELVQLGTWDDETGKHENFEAPKQLATGKTVKL